MKPPLKWAGGKRRILKHILPHVPEDYSRYVEPFAGGAALFFELEPKCNSVLADTNSDLIYFYRTLQQDLGTFEDILGAGRPKNTPEAYYAIRDRFNERTESRARQAAIFWYLNATGYSGLYRVNQKGGFNVPFGNRKNPKLHDPEAWRKANAVLADTDLLCTSAFDLPGVLSDISGDFWYLDPPYDQTFNGYGAWDGWEDQVRVFELYKCLTESGAKVLLSSSATQRILDMYQNHGTIQHLSATYSIRQTADTRDKAGEILVKNW